MQINQHVASIREPFEYSKYRHNFYQNKAYSYSLLNRSVNSFAEYENSKMRHDKDTIGSKMEHKAAGWWGKMLFGSLILGCFEHTHVETCI